jgi:hypothetical protein
VNTEDFEKAFEQRVLAWTTRIAKRLKSSPELKQKRENQFGLPESIDPRLLADYVRPIVRLEEFDNALGIFAKRVNAGFYAQKNLYKSVKALHKRVLKTIAYARETQESLSFVFSTVSSTALSELESIEKRIKQVHNLIEPPVSHGGGGNLKGSYNMQILIAWLAMENKDPEFETNAFALALALGFTKASNVVEFGRQLRRAKRMARETKIVLDTPQLDCPRPGAVSREKK